jgi:CHAT domain-containing protein
MRRWVHSTALVAVVALASAVEAQTPDVEALEEIGRLHAEMIERRGEGALYPAIELGERRLALLRRIYDDDALQVTAAMQELASLHQTVGDYARAIEIYERVVAIAEASPAADADALPRALDMLASVYWIQQRFGDAEPIFERSLSLRREHHGPRSAAFAHALTTYGSFLWARHAYSAAESAFLRAFCIMLGEHGRGSVQLTGTLVSLAWMHALRGEVDRARVYLSELRRAADGAENYPGQRVMLLSTAVALYRQFGLERETLEVERELEAHYRRELDALTRTHGDAAPELSQALGSLGGLLQRAERWDEAERVYHRLIAITEAAHGEDSLALAGWLQALSATVQGAGRPEEAAAYLDRAGRVFRAHHGPTTTFGIDLMRADAHVLAGDRARARGLLDEVIRTVSQVFGPSHINLALALERRGLVAMADGRLDVALDDLERAYAIHEPHIELIMSAGTEADNQAYFRQTAHHVDTALTLNARHAPASARAARFAYTTVLRRKGRVLDAAASAIERVRDELGARGQALLDELSAARAQLAALIVAGPEATGPHHYRRELVRLEREVRRLEQLVRARSASFRATSQPIELHAVQAAVPEGAALVEIVFYHAIRAEAPVGRGRAARGRYAAYVIAGAGAPVLVDLGPASAIDRAITRFRRALADPRRSDARARGRELYDLVFAPLEPALGARRELLLAPDAALNLVPFAALVDAGDRYLVRRFTFTYLTSGRDLLRLGSSEGAGGTPVIVADPAFDRGAPGPAAVRAGPRVRGALAPEFQLTSWERLPGTGAEADTIAAVLGEAVVLRGERATEAAIKRVRRPPILHIATHGFFLPAAERPAGDDQAGQVAAAAASFGAMPVASGADHPLLRSGLVFAGVNQLESGGDDGVLTALEAAGLDLRGTRLVVLSACETGVGDTAPGDGVHGLRRAFVLAGAETVVMSLWQVDDEATRALMSGFYRHLHDGLGRTEALRRVQLETLNSDRYRHPYYWASFLPAGDWTPIDTLARP